MLKVYVITTLSKIISNVKDGVVQRQFDMIGAVKTVRLNTTILLPQLLLLSSKNTLPDRPEAPYAGVLPFPYTQVCPREFTQFKSISLPS